MSLHALATRFHQLHAPDAGRPLVLVNAWDGLTARLIEETGAPALATTSAGISWALGRPDGQGVTREAMLAAVRTLVAAVRIPVSVDAESGYGDGSPAAVAETARGVLAAGAVGLNLEDAPGRDGAVLLDAEANAARIAAARAAAGDVPLFINARTDVMLRKVGAEADRFDETVRRARLYVAAGADGIFVPGVSDASTIQRLAEAVGAPLNVIGGPGVPDVGALHALGVRRVSVGPGLARAVAAQVRRAAAELLGAGTYDAIADQIPSPELNALFGAR